MNTRVGIREKASPIQWNKPILQQKELNLDVSQLTQDQTLNKESNIKQNVKVESEDTQNQQDRMECDSDVILFSECLDVPWDGSETSDVVYRFSEYG